MKRMFLGFLLLCVSLPACKEKAKYPYAIRDFSPTLQPYLIRVVSKGIVDYDSASSFIREHTTDEELQKLSLSEHPLLRGTALLAMLDRKSIDHYETIMNHLDDTTIAVFDAGEWGVEFHMVSDELLFHGKWKDSAAFNKTIETVITNHNYLRQAYAIIARIQPQEKYYPYIREMAQREENYRMSYYKQRIEALYALAKFKKKEDVALIQELLIEKKFDLNDMAFELLKEYPQEAYEKVFTAFYPRNFYYTFNHEWKMDRAISFIESIASYKNEWSAGILKKIWERKPFTPMNMDTSYVRSVFLQAIRANPCPAYKPWEKIIDSIKRREAIDIKIESFDVGTDIFTDTTPEPIRWW